MNVELRDFTITVFGGSSYCHFYVLEVVCPKSLFCSDFLVGVKLEKIWLNLYRSFVGLVVERAKGLPKLFSDMNHNHNHTRGHRYIEYVLLTDLLSRRTIEST